ncbi:MAG TPA: ornithine cyclodeaminase family protein [Gemmatimonadales bacterium]|nr:ornithine cyclodeaminase family protein [Gemmatimonadales bacterium]
MTLLLSQADVDALLGPGACIAAVEGAFRRRGEGPPQPAGVLAVHLARGGVHVKVAADSGVLAAKVNANFPGNPAELGLPTIQGLVMLVDEGSGAPAAVMESGSLTRLRTAAATAVAARYLARADSRTATVIGCGAQAAAQLAFLHRVRPLERAMAFDLRRDLARRYAARLSAELGIPVEPVDRYGPACLRSDVILTCTSSREAFLGLEDVPSGAFVAAVGADNPGKRELRADLFAGGAAALVTDLTAQCAELGELRHGLADGVLTLDGVRAELGEVVAGRKPGRRTDGERIVFDSTGSAIQDAAAAAAVLERARSLGTGTRYDFVSGT